MYKLENGEELTQQDREAFKKGLTRAYIKYGTTIMDQSNFLMNAQYRDEKADPENGQFIGVTSMRELKIKLNNLENALDLENKDIEYHLGAKVGNEYKYINFGNFIVQKPNNEEVNEETTFTALDYMCKFDIDEPYVPEVVFPTTLAGLAEDVCRQVEVELGNTDFRNADMPILANPFLNGENPRTVLKSIAKLSFSCAYIGQDNKLYFGFTWYEDELFTVNNFKLASFNTNLEYPLQDIRYYGGTSQKTYSGKNIMPSANLSETTRYGVTITPVYENDILQYINVNGTYEDIEENPNNYGYTIGYTDFVEGKSYTISGVTGYTSSYLQLYIKDDTIFTGALASYNGKTTKTAIGSGNTRTRLFIYKGKTYDNVKVYPMLCEDNTDDTYEPYVGGIASPNPSYKQDIKLVSGQKDVIITKKNLFVIAYEAGYEETINGVTFKVNGDGSVLVNGTATGANAQFYLNGTTNRTEKIYAGTYRLSNGIAYGDKGSSSTYNVSFRTQNIDTHDNRQYFSNGYTYTLDNPSNTYSFYITIYNGYTANNLLFKPMLEEGSVETDFEKGEKQELPLTLKNKNYFNINDLSTTAGQLQNIDVNVTNGVLTLTAISTNGAQYTRWFGSGFDANKTYTLSFKAKKVVKGTDGRPWLIIQCYGSNDGTTYTNLGGASNQNPTQGETYELSRSLTGYTYYRFYIYNNSNTPVTLGEQTQYWDIMFNEGAIATPYIEYGADYDYSLAGINTSKDYIYETSGKNLFSSVLELGTIGNNTGAPGSATDCLRSKDFIEVLPNTTYTISNDLDYANYIYEYDNSKTFIVAHTGGAWYHTKTFTTEATTRYIKVRSIASGVQNDLSVKYMLNKGTIALTYEPYGSDEWYKKEHVKETIFIGAESENWGSAVNNLGNRFFQIDITDYLRVEGITCICNYYTAVENGAYGTLTNGTCRLRYFNDEAYKFYICDNSQTGATSFKTWLSTHNVILRYILARPQDTKITAPTLIAQLNAIKNAHTYNGTTIITTSQDEDTLQPYLDVTYTKRQFPTADENLAETITVDGYFENKPNNQVKPISAITLRSSEVKAAGQTIYDDELIEQYGVNELIVEEDYIAYTDTLRNAFLEGARGLFGLTYKPLDIDLLGSVYLSFNDGIKVINPQGETYRTFALNNTHEYNGTLYNSISIPALSEVEEKYLYETEDKTLRRKTAIEIDKANQQIQSIVSEIGDRSEKQTTITQDIDSIELKISDIEDLTVEKVGNNPLTLDNCLEGNLLQFKIKGNNTVFSGLEPSSSLVPSDTLVPQGDSILKVYTNNKCFTENGKWLPQGRNLNETMVIQTTWYLGVGYYNITNEIYYKLYKYTESYRIGYIRCEKGHTYSINMPKTYSGSFACAVFDETLLEKMDTQMEITPLVAYGNASYNNGSFSYNNNIKNYDFIVEQDGYIVIYIPNASLYDIEIYDRSTTDVFSIASDLMEVDNDYSMYFSIKGNPSFVLTNIYYYNSNKALLGNYYTYYSRDIKNGLNNTEIILPKNTKYISLEIKKKDSNDNFINIGDFDIKNIKPMLEYVAKYKNNSTYSGDLANWVAELNAIYNYNYYYIGNSQILKATNTTEFEFEYTEFENDREESAILGTGNNTDFVFYTKTDGLTEEQPYKKKLFIYNGTEYAINTQNDFLNVKTKVSFKKDTNTGNYTLKLEDEENHIEEFTIPVTTSFESEGYLGFFSNKSTATTANLKIYSIKCWNNGDLVLDYVPALNKNNSRIGLYNVVTNLITTWQDYSGVGSAGLKYFVAPESNYENYNNQILDLGITEPLRQLNSEVYDELIYDYEEELYNWKIIRRVGVTSGGELYELTNEVIEYLELPLISLAEGVNYIDIGLPYIANCYAKYVQINEFTKEFATTYQVESMITQLANSITLLVREKVNKEEVIAELNLEISQGKGIVRITGNQVIIDSDYFHLTADGQITATEGHIAGFRMWQDTQSEETRSWLTKDFVYNGDDYRSGLLVRDDYNSDFLFAGMPLVSGWDTSNAATRILHNGTMYVKRINFNSESGYARYLFDSGRIALEIDRNQMIFRVDDTNNTIFAAFVQGIQAMQVNLIGALGFRIYDELHQRVLYNADPNAGNIPNHYFTGVMWVDRDLDGNYIRVAQDGDWLSDERLKKDIKDSKTNALEIIDKLSFKQFTWNEETRKSGTHINIGLIAQDVEKIDENFVYVTPRIKNDKQEDLLSIDVLNLLSTTAKAVQELNDIVKKQQEEIDSLKKEIEKLKGEK